MFLQSAKSASLASTSLLTQSRESVAGPFGLTHCDGRRQSTGRQLRNSITRLPNLDVLLGGQIQRLVLDGPGEKVIAIQYTHGSTPDLLNLQIEGQVILSAGAIGSPALLLRSGIGDAQQLAVAGVDCRVDLPHVGRNLGDHLAFPLVYQAQMPNGLPRRFSIADRERYRQSGYGPLASNIAEAGAFFEIDSGMGKEHFQIHFTPTHYLKYPQTSDPNCFSLAITQLTPRSSGSVSLCSKESKNLVVAIDPGYLSDPIDVAAFSQAVAWAQDTLGNAMQSIALKQLLPGKRGQSDAGRVKSIRAFAQSIYHPTSTCRMGDSAQDSVVDTNFGVHGMSNLKLADASVLPSIPRANTQAVTFWAASRCLDVLLGQPNS